MYFCNYFFLFQTSQHSPLVRLFLWWGSSLSGPRICRAWLSVPFIEDPSQIPGFSCSQNDSSTSGRTYLLSFQVNGIIYIFLNILFSEMSFTETSKLEYHPWSNWIIFFYILSRRICLWTSTATWRLPILAGLCMPLPQSMLIIFYKLTLAARRKERESPSLRNRKIMEKKKIVE